MKLDELTLIQYVELDLDEADLIQVEQLLKTDESARANVQMLRGTHSIMASTFGTLKDAKPPESLRKKFHQPDHNSRGWIWSSRTLLQVAVSLAIGAVIGAIGSRELETESCSISFDQGLQIYLGEISGS